MLIRALIATAVAATLGTLIWLLAPATDPVLVTADGQLGERWYRLTLDDRHVGYLRSSTRRDQLGRWHFDSDLRFSLGGGRPVSVRESLVFSGSPPYPLLRASQTHQRARGTDGTLFQRTRDRYRVSRVNGDAIDPTDQVLDLAFTLSDYLRFETWLRESRPAPGATAASAALDFRRRRVVSRQLTVVARNATGYALEHTAPLEATRIQLDARLRPVAMTLSGLFELEQTTRAEALAPRSALLEAGYFVPADRSLSDHTEIRALELEVRGEAEASDLWPELARGNTLRRVADAVSSPALNGDELEETAEHPVSDPRIRSLARDAVAGVTDRRQQAIALTRFVHGFLRYQADGVYRPVLSLLTDRTGDCSEYADLLTTLARALGIPSRTVFGLAYAAEGTPAFRFHAWNELRVDGDWLVVDPTWNEIRVDATHLPLPTDATHALDLLTGGMDVSFAVRNVEYF